MRAVIRGIHSPDARDLESFYPDDPENFELLLQIMAGPHDGPGAESFDVVVCSPRWLEAQLKPGEIRSGRHYLITLGWNWAELQRDIRRRVESCEGNDWGEVALKLARLGHWEFEDDTPYVNG
jgi:hypothetical protein